MKTNDLIKMNLRNLQLFAEDGGEFVDNKGSDSNDNAGTDQGEKETRYTQSELDSQINKAIQAHIAKNEKAQQEKIEKEVEARLAKKADYAKLSEDERQKRELDDERNAFQEEKAKFEHEKLVVQLQSDLVKKGLPAELAETFALHTDQEKALEAVSALEKSFKDAVAEGIKQSLRQETPSLGANSGSKQSNYGEQLANKFTRNSKKIID